MGKKIEDGDTICASQGDCPTMKRIAAEFFESDLRSIEMVTGNLIAKSVNPAIKKLTDSKNLYGTRNMDALINMPPLGDGPSVRVAKQLLSAIDNPRGRDPWTTKFAQSNAGDVDLLRRLLEANKLVLASAGRA